METKTEHRIISCPHCPVKMRIAVTEAQYGRTVEVACPQCKQKTKVIILAPDSENAGELVYCYPADFFRGTR